MAKQTIATAQRPSAFWLGQAEHYENLASTLKDPERQRVWWERAAEARRKAACETPVSPAPSEAESPT